MRMKRILLAGFVALGLAPGTFVRPDLPERDYRSSAQINAIEVEPLVAGPLMLENAWELTSANHYFGGFSSLVAGSDGVLYSANDVGRLIAFPRPDRAIEPIRILPFLATRKLDLKAADVESLTIDPATDRLWAALERSQEIVALGAPYDRRDSIRPVEMEGWGKNAGPEAMVRLADGRFIVIEEGESGSGLHEALLFPGDPVAGLRPAPFTFQARDGYEPSDAALLPDGRVAVLLRGLEIDFPPRFPAQIVIADPKEIEEGAVLSSTLLARIEAPLPSDNYEGLTVIDEGEGNWTLWLMSDDNFSRYQRTLLLKFRWEVPAGQIRQKARR